MMTMMTIYHVTVEGRYDSEPQRYDTLASARASVADEQRPWQIHREIMREEPDICTATRGLPSLRCVLRVTVEQGPLPREVPVGRARVCLGVAVIDADRELAKMAGLTVYADGAVADPQGYTIRRIAQALSEGHVGEDALLRAIALGEEGSRASRAPEVLAAKLRVEAETIAAERVRMEMAMTQMRATAE